MVGRSLWVDIPAEATHGNHSLQVPSGPWYKEVLWFKLDLMPRSCLVCIAGRLWLDGLSFLCVLWAWGYLGIGYSSLWICSSLLQSQSVVEPATWISQVRVCFCLWVVFSSKNLSLCVSLEVQWGVKSGRHLMKQVFSDNSLSGIEKQLKCTWEKLCLIVQVDASKAHPELSSCWIAPIRALKQSI